ncbi:hypothetical protein T484DRAFT_1988184, partial [Baffinella frigidus]
RDGKQARVTTPPHSGSGGHVHPEPRNPADADAATFQDYVPPALEYEPVLVMSPQAAEPSPVMNPRGGGWSPRRVEPAALDAPTEQPGVGPANVAFQGGPTHRRQAGPAMAWLEPPRAHDLPDTAVFQEPKPKHQASAGADEWEPLDIQEPEFPDIQRRRPTGGFFSRRPAENAGAPPRVTPRAMLPMLPRSMGARLTGLVDDPAELDEWEPMDIQDRGTLDIQGRS